MLKCSACQKPLDMNAYPIQTNGTVFISCQQCALDTLSFMKSFLGVDLYKQFLFKQIAYLNEDTTLSALTTDWQRYIHEEYNT